MSLHGTVVGVNCSQQRIKGNIADVFVTIEKDTSQYVDGQNPQSTLRFDVHDGQDSLVQNGITDILGRFSVGGHLSQYIVHGFWGFTVVVTQNTQQSKDFYLQQIFNIYKNIIFKNKKLT